VVWCLPSGDNCLRMSVKPTLLKDIRRTAIHNHQASVGTGEYNRWSPLVQRERTFSYGKRKLTNDVSGADVIPGNAPKAAKFDATVVFEQLKGQDMVLAEVKSIMDKFDTEIKLDDTVAPPVRDAITLLGTAVKSLLCSQTNLTSVLVDAFKLKDPHSPPAPKDAVTKKQASLASAPAPAPKDPKVEAAKKVKQALREAERKTVIFNLDLGKVPTMNKETLSRKVTLALSSAASAGNHDYDIRDAEDVIDDILSCSKLEFLGATTKKFNNKKDPKDVRNDKMCTIPVRFEFKDRDTRQQAEVNLRKICGVGCAVPYPKRLRAVLDKVIQDGKKEYPNSFISTRVNIDKLLITASAKTSEGWKDLKTSQPIPLDILEKVTNTAILDEQMTIS
jgi:hypothetical protein